jgi:SAM-dependent methyltransferase
MYERYAEVFEEVVSQLDYIHWAAFVADLVAKSGRPAPASLLDLGCGGGQCAVQFAKMNYAVTGVDISAAMIARTRARAEAAAVPVQLIQGDMTELSLPEPADAAVSTFDTIAYLASLEKLDALFAMLARNLRPGGVFVCNLLLDLSWLVTKNIVINNDRYTVFYEPRLDGKTLHMKLTGFIKKGDLYEKFQEEHAEREHSPEELIAAAAGHGFALLETVPYFAQSIEGKVAKIERPHFVFRKASG